MSTKQTTANPQQIFDSALAILDQNESNLGKSKIARSLPLRASFDSSRLKERALKDAAHALAEIWKR